MIPQLAIPGFRAVLLELDSCDDDHRRYVRTIAEDMGLPVEQLRQILLRMNELGLATYGPIFTDDGSAAGCTWWLTEAGIALRDAIERQAA